MVRLTIGLRLGEKAMRAAGMLLWASMTLALAAGAHAQTAASEKAMFDQARPGADLPMPALPPNVTDLTRSLQVELKRVGCFEGAIDAVWGSATQGALAEFARRAKLDVPTDAPTPTAVETVKSQSSRICPLVCGAGLIERNGTCVAKAVPEAKPARPQPTAETKRAPRETERPNSGMCWRNDSRGMALVPCSEAPTGRRAY